MESLMIVRVRVGYIIRSGIDAGTNGPQLRVLRAGISDRGSDENSRAAEQN